MSIVPAATLPTRSEIQSCTLATDLTRAATRWQRSATQSENAFGEQHARILTTDWSGDAKDAAMTSSSAAVQVVGAQNRIIRAAIDIAAGGSFDMQKVRQEVLDAITAVEKDGFLVGEDLSLTDTTRVTIFTAQARNQSAAEHAEDIRWHAQRFAQTKALINQRLVTHATELNEIRFDGEGQGHDSTVQAVDYNIRESPAAIEGKGIEVDDDAINDTQPPLSAPSHTHDPAFGSSPKSALERTLSGTGGRADGEAAVAYLRARGWNTAADVIQHYLANESGDGDPSVGKSLQLSTAQTDAMANDTVNGYRNGLPTVPDLLGRARDEALQNAASAGQPVYTEVYGTEPGQQNAPGWNVVGGSNPDTVYSLGEYSVQVVTQVETGAGGPIVHQRYYVYDYTDFSHNNDTITHPGSLSSPFNALKMTTIDELSTLRDIGYARGFNTYGASTIRTYP